MVGGCGIGQDYGHLLLSGTVNIENLIICEFSQENFSYFRRVQARGLGFNLRRLDEDNIGTGGFGVIAILRESLRRSLLRRSSLRILRGRRRRSGGGSRSSFEQICCRRWPYRFVVLGIRVLGLIIRAFPTFAWK